jgi:hypothetical protein
MGLDGLLHFYLTLKEGHRLRMLENRALRRIFGAERDEISGG